MTYMLLKNCALNLAEEIILYYDARSKKHQIGRVSSYSRNTEGTYATGVLLIRLISSSDLECWSKQPF